MKLLATVTLAPILCFAVQDLGSEYGGMDWLTKGYAAWPMMIAPVLMLLLFIKHRDLIRDPAKGANFSQVVKITAFLFLIPNVFTTIGYSWLAAFSVVASLTILVADRQLKKQGPA
jgi:hypothetical protein